MTTNKDYTFEVSISNDAYVDKIISGAMIGSSKDEKNKEIRKQYGYKQNQGVGYKRITTTPEALLNNLLDGHVFCHLFNPTKTRKDGTFASTEKKDANFVGSYVIGVDIDKTNYNTVEDFVSQLLIPPTFYYTTYSNLKDNKGARFRLIYVFDELLDNPFFFRYAAYALNQLIEKDTKENIEDDCNLRCSQYFNGTNRNTEGIILSYGITNNIYSLSDINCTIEGYVDFLRHYCYYKTYSIDKINIISNILYYITGINYSFNYSTTYYTDLENRTTSISFDYDINQYKCDAELASDMRRLSYDEFMKYNRHKFNYYYRVEKDEWIDGIYQYIDNDYFALFWNSRRIKDGEHRRKKIFERMCLRRVINPSVDADTLLFNAYEDMNRFFETDKDLNIDCLVRNVEKAMQMSIEDIKQQYSEHIAYLKSRKPKSGIIIKSGLTKDIADRNKYLKHIRWTLIADYYDYNLSVNENLILLKENLFEVSKSTIYNFLNSNNVKTPNKITDEELYDLIDINLSANKNLDMLRDNNIKVSRLRLLNIYKIKSNM